MTIHSMGTVVELLKDARRWMVEADKTWPGSRCEARLQRTKELFARIDEVVEAYTPRGGIVSSMAYPSQIFGNDGRLSPGYLCGCGRMVGRPHSQYCWHQTGDEPCACEEVLMSKERSDQPLGVSSAEDEDTWCDIEYDVMTEAPDD